ncbi:MAG TPA: thioredoxin family protein, partial [Patescibacteria group bacterium]|nr:thioredoxin family protein [Patescibacteria group bacterium]
AIAFGLWLLKKGSGNIIVRALAAISFIVAAALVPLGGKMQAQTAQVMNMGGDWEPFVASDFEKLMQGTEPLFVDMTAAWCITCKVNENAVLNTAGITDLFHKRKVQTIRGDWTNQNPEITAFLAKFGRNGVPIYVYYGPRSPATHERPEPVVLPQLLTAGIVENAVEGK